MLSVVKHAEKRIIWWMLMVVLLFPESVKHSGPHSEKQVEG
jgi:hypothetical protein